MPEVIFELPNGDVRTATVDMGESVMRAALLAEIPGIQAECSGQLTCATCHVYVTDEWSTAFPPPTEAENDLLEILDEPRPSSRLSCQLRVGDATDGVRLGVPASG